MLEADPESIDARRFSRLVEDGLRRASEGDPEAGGTLLRSALALWGGPPLSDFPYEEFVQAHVRRLSEQRLAALEGLASAELDLGNAVQALALLDTALAMDGSRPFSDGITTTTPCGSLMSRRSRTAARRPTAARRVLGTRSKNGR